jgi:hypothetical protein
VLARRCFIGTPESSRPAVSVWWQQKRENAKTPRACAGGKAIAPAGLLIRFD